MSKAYTDAQIERIVREVTGGVDGMMTHAQEQGIARVLAGMGLRDDGPEVARILWQVDLPPHAWRLRALSEADANSVLEILGRYLEVGVKPPPMEGYTASD